MQHQLRSAADGRLGTLRVHRSGKLKLHIGNQIFDVRGRLRVVPSLAAVGAHRSARHGTYTRVRLSGLHCDGEQLFADSHRTQHHRSARRFTGPHPSPTAGHARPRDTGAVSRRTRGTPASPPPKKKGSSVASAQGTVQYAPIQTNKNTHARPDQRAMIVGRPRRHGKPPRAVARLEKKY